MKREKSFRVFIIYALLLQFMVLVSQQAYIQRSLPDIRKNYNTRDATVQVVISFAEIGETESVMVAYTGTGTVIAENDDDVYVLTAQHVCAPAVSSPAAKQYGLEPVLEIYDVDGSYHDADVILLATYDDLCVIKFTDESYGYREVAHVSSTPPTPDSQAHMYAAPSGFYVPSAITKFSGTFAGNARLAYAPVSGVYTIPAAGGSSGAAIINKDGEIIGVLHSTLVDFHHISLASTYEATIDFIKELELQEGIMILD